jgi:hypothetical protein
MEIATYPSSIYTHVDVHISGEETVQPTSSRTKLAEPHRPALRWEDLRTPLFNMEEGLEEP